MQKRFALLNGAHLWEDATPIDDMLISDGRSLERSAFLTRAGCQAECDVLKARDRVRRAVTLFWDWLIGH